MIVRIVVFVFLMSVWSFIRIRSMLSIQKNKEAAVFGGLNAVSSIIGSSLIMRVDIPNMVVPFKIIFEPIGKMLLMQ